MVSYLKRGFLFLIYFLIYHKSSIKPLPGGGGAYLLQAHLRRGGLIEMGGLFNLEKKMVSVLRKELEDEMEKLKYKTF